MAQAVTVVAAVVDIVLEDIAQVVTVAVKTT